MVFQNGNKYGKNKTVLLPKLELKKLLQQGYSFNDIARKYKKSVSTISKICSNYGITNFNIHIKYLRHTQKYCKTVERINTDLVPSYYIDRTNISFRRDKGHDKNTLKGYNFITLYDKEKTYLYFTKNHKKENILEAISKFLQLKILSEESVIMCDTEFNPPDNHKSVNFCNAKKGIWHACVNKVESKHGFKKWIYAFVLAFKNKPYKKISKDNKQKALILKGYLQFINNNPNFILVNKKHLVKEISQLERNKEIITIKS